MIKKIVAGITLISFCTYVFLIIPKTPSNDRNWSVDQAILPNITKNGDMVTVQNVRNFSYASTTAYTPAYYTQTYDINKLKRVWYIVEPFNGEKLAAHTFLSFEFENDIFLSVSVEIRKEKGEKFSALKGMLREYELMYVFADERDVVQLRSNHRKDIVYMYPVQTSAENVRALFTDIVTRAQTLEQNPEFYNTLTNNCMINIIRHVNTISPSKIPFTFAAIFPVYSDVVAHRLKLIPHDASVEEIRARYKINEKAEAAQGASDFSIQIRKGF